MRSRIVALLLALLMGAVALLGETLAWDTEQQALNNMLYGDATAYVTLHKLEKAEDGVALEAPLPGAVFQLYKADETLIGGPFVTDANGQIRVALGGGDFYFEEVAPADGFTYDRDSSGGIIKKYPFTVSENDTAITVTAYNRRQPDGESVEIVGEKTWDRKGAAIALPGSITVYLMDGDTKVDAQTVSPDAEGRWRYRFTAPKYRADGTQIHYAIKEEAVEGFHAAYSGYDIKNSYLLPLSLPMPEITKVVEGEDAPETNFVFVMKGEGESPMPDGAVDGVLTVARTGRGSVALEPVVFTKPGEYLYTVYEKAGSDPNWKYDSSEYTITVRIEEDASGLRGACTIQKAGESVDGIIFCNSYEKLDTDRIVTISGQKTWYHKTNASENWPSSIVVQVYADGVLVHSRRVTAEEDWKYSFELPMFDEAGRELQYEVDEVELPNYSKKVRGYDLINTYVGTETPPPSEDPTPPTDTEKPGGTTPSGPSSPEKPGPPADTSDPSGMNFWMTATVIGFIGFLVMSILFIRQPSYAVGQPTEKKNPSQKRKAIRHVWKNGRIQRVDEVRYVWRKNQRADAREAVRYVWKKDATGR